MQQCHYNGTLYNDAHISRMIKKIFILILIAIVLAVVYFASLHLSKPQDLSQQDLALRDMLQQGQVLQKDSSTQAPAEQTLKQQQSSQQQPLQQREDPEIPVVIKRGMFNPDAEDSDYFHRGRGSISIVRFMNTNRLVFGEDFHITNGPDYRIYLLTKQGVETKAAFLQLKSGALQLARLKQFEGYQVFPISSMVDIDNVQAVLIWCETFRQFISNADLN